MGDNSHAGPRVIGLLLGTGMFFAVLFWCAVVGDEFQRVRSLLTHPDVLLGLKRHLGSVQEAQFMLARYVDRLDLGFTLINVTLTTHRVLSLLASAAVTTILVLASLHSALVAS